MLHVGGWGAITKSLASGWGHNSKEPSQLLRFTLLRTPLSLRYALYLTAQFTMKLGRRGGSQGSINIIQFSFHTVSYFISNPQSGVTKQSVQYNSRKSENPPEVRRASVQPWNWNRRRSWVRLLCFHMKKAAGQVPLLWAVRIHIITH